MGNNTGIYVRCPHHPEIMHHRDQPCSRCKADAERAAGVMVVCEKHNRAHPKYAQCPECERETMSGRAASHPPLLGYFSLANEANPWLAEHHAKGYVFNMMTVWQGAIVIAISHKGN